MEFPNGKAGVHPPRLKADHAEDPFNSAYEEHPERWIGAERSHKAKASANLLTAVGSSLAGGGPTVFRGWWVVE